MQDEPITLEWLLALGLSHSDKMTYWYAGEYGECDAPWLIRWSGGFHLKISTASVAMQASRKQFMQACDLFGIKDFKGEIFNGSIMDGVAGVAFQMERQRD